MKCMWMMTAALLSLGGEVSMEGRFVATLAGVFSITVEETGSTDLYRTMTADLDESSSSQQQMGQFHVVITDTTTLSSGESNIVRMHAMHFDSTDNVELVRRDQTGEITTQDDRIQLYITDDKDSDGNTNTTVIKNDSVVRQRDFGESTFSNETHTITVNTDTGEVVSKTAGDYRVLVFFGLESS